MIVDGKYVGHIYIITNSANGKTYVGQTRQEPRKRWWQHQEASRDEKTLHLVLYRAMNKYGIDNFTFKVIEAVSAKDECDLTRRLNDRESYWINKYNSHGRDGYNMTDGGSDSPKIRSNRVVELNYDGVVVGVYNSASEAGDIRHTKTKNIHHGCKSKTHYCMRTDSFWYYENDISETNVTPGDIFAKQEKCTNYFFKEGNQVGSKRVAEYSYDGELLGIYNSIEDAGRRSRVSECSVRRILQGQTDYVKGVTFIQVS